MDTVDRRRAMFRFRTQFGWDAAYVASLVDVTPRTVGLWETGDQPVPEARWRLFMHEVRLAVTDASKAGRSMVIVLAEDGLTPIDAVSDRNYISFDRDGDIGFIASFVIDRETRQPTVHQQRFRCSLNEHVVRAAEAWEAARLATAHGPDAAMLTTMRWLTRRTLAAERENPELRALKDAINAATREVDAAIQAPEDVMRAKLAAQEQAIYALMAAVERTPLI